MDVFRGLLFSQPRKAIADGGRVQLGPEAQTPKWLRGLQSVCCSCFGPGRWEQEQRPEGLAGRHSERS